MTVTISMAGESRELVLGRTTAPFSYDHGLMITLAEFQENNTDHRIVLLSAESVEWQKGRNASGLFVFTDDEEDDYLAGIDDSIIRTYLWERFYPTENDR